MSDPAVEAAQRAWDALPERFYATREQVMEAAAREMAKSVQDLHVPFMVTSPDDEQWIECESCRGEYWPCETAKRVYPSEELGL
ncbi:hypothetical protein R2325_16320 [Mycobacteroides chelonae]|jgi:hypothetical protein|uniref:hypothetical protein n=1 Tax=Mycobacteroides TaxID=670516 RepID=UPI000926B90C|nr:MULTISPECIES: hypothetical protein [Mycobacteroides]MBV6360419.1 hypothetical protein [Mycobacteroides chelonae]MEC4857140.1 hypothetical protein [Mycobacteroides chelonae]MEC4873550.1 hypothetical protein [Mycobacteroides chelonae]SHW93373.1 Uncharacterised protein [Mycobacteroides abscessus subsp. abscessus]SKL81379.1 Uncharacterised protein [Mycobacteroides abscessus subsp. abscessus]